MTFSDLVELYEVVINNEVAHKKHANPQFDGGNIFGNRKSALLFFMKSFELTDQDEVAPYLDAPIWRSKYDALFKVKIAAVKKDASTLSNVRRIATFYQNAFSISEALSANSIAERLRRSRELSGMTRNQLAKKIGLKCDGGQIKGYEEGRKLKNHSETRLCLTNIENVLGMPSGTLTELLPPAKGNVTRTDRGMGKYILGRFLTYAHRELSPVMKDEFDWYFKFKTELHLAGGLFRTTRWTKDQLGKCSTALKNKSHFGSMAGYACLPKSGEKMTDVQWAKIAKFCTRTGVARADLDELQKGEGFDREKISITDLADRDLLGRYDAFLLRRQNLIRKFSGEMDNEATSSTIIMHLIAIEHLFEPRHGGATQNSALFNKRELPLGEWQLFCLKINHEIRKLREEINHRLVENDTNALIKRCCNPEKPLEEIFKFLQNFDRFAYAQPPSAQVRRAAYYLISSFPLRINSLLQLRTTSLVFVPNPQKPDEHGEVYLEFDKAILKNGRDIKSRRFKRDPRPRAKLWLMDHLYGTNTYKVLKEYVEKVRPGLDGADGPLLFPVIDVTAPFTDTEAFTPSKLKFGWHKFRNFVATHAKRNFPEGREAAANLLLNTARMIDAHYGSLQTEDVQADLEKLIKENGKKPNSRAAAPVDLVGVAANAAPLKEPTILEILKKMDGPIAAASLPDETLDLILSDYSDATANKVRLALKPLRLAKVTA